MRVCGAGAGFRQLAQVANSGSWRTFVLIFAGLAAFVLFGEAPVIAQAAQNLDGRVAPRPITTSELVEASGLSGLAVSPDGTVAIVRVDQEHISSNLTELSWYRITLKDGKAMRLGGAGEPLWDVNGGLETVVPQWSADGRWIYYRGLKHQQVHGWRLKADGARHEQITRSDADVEAFLLAPGNALHLAVEGATRAEIQHAEAEEYDRGVLIDSTVIAGFPIVRSFPLNGRMATYRNLLSTSRNFGRGPLLGDKPLRVLTLNASDQIVESAPINIAERFATWWTRLVKGSTCGCWCRAAAICP